MIPGESQAALARFGYRLVAATLAYNVLEGIVSVWWGSRTDSSALVAFGLDSGIEVAAGAALLWRLRAPSEASERAERAARRFIGGGDFLIRHSTGVR